jgi:hypothetical protein
MAVARAIPTEKLYAADEFEAIPEFGDRYELIEGRIVKKPMPSADGVKVVWLINPKDKVVEIYRQNQSQPQIAGINVILGKKI